MNRPVFDVRALLDDRSVRVIITAGTGGVGKTSVSAALAVQAAEAGRKVVLLTVDPAKRLATALGLDQLGSEAEPVAGVGPGSLDALMLDMTSTFDEAVRQHAHGSPEAVLANPYYRALSTSFSGTQDYMATEKLGQLSDEAVESGRWDLIVVDTPPSRSALDFLDAPQRLERLAEGPLFQILAPRQGPLKLLSSGLSQVTKVVTRVIGASALTDLQEFAQAFREVMGGFRNRANRVQTLLESAQTAFVVVATPRRAALQEATYLLDRLSQRRAKARGVIINRFEAPLEPVPGDIADPQLVQWWVYANRRAENAGLAIDELIDRRVPVATAGLMDREVTDVAALRDLGSLVLDSGLSQQDGTPVIDV